MSGLRVIMKLQSDVINYKHFFIAKVTNCLIHTRMIQDLNLNY